MRLRNLILKNLLKISPLYRKQAYIQTLVQESINSHRSESDRLNELLKNNQLAIDQLHSLVLSTNEMSRGLHLKLEMMGSALDVERLPKSKGALRDIQLISLEMLQVVDRICKKHKLQFWLDFGTLLGAVRHKGFIPWDDDMDISMMSEDYARFLAVVDYELKDTDFRFIHVPSQIGKIVHKDFMPHGEEEVTKFIDWDVHDKIMFALDISPYYYAKNTIPKNDLNEHIALATENKNKALFDGGLRYSNFRKAAGVVDDLHKQVGTTRRSNRLFMGLEVLAIKIATRPWVVETDNVFPLKSIEFEGNAFPAPRDTELYLTSAYGDYMKLPKDIHTHMHLNDAPIDELIKLKNAARTLEVEKLC